MTKYAVYGTVTISITMLVEASDETESIIKAESEYPGLMNLVGNHSSPSFHTERYFSTVSSWRVTFQVHPSFALRGFGFCSLFG